MIGHRYIERETEGQIDVNNGELRIFNGDGKELASIKPTREQWGMIAAIAIEQIRRP